MERITEVEGLGPRAGAYVFATIFGNNVETSGQIGMDRNGDLVEGGSAVEQAVWHFAVQGCVHG